MCQVLSIPTSVGRATPDHRMVHADGFDAVTGDGGHGGAEGGHGSAGKSRAGRMYAAEALSGVESFFPFDPYLLRHSSR